MTYNFLEFIELFTRVVIKFYFLLDMIYYGRIVYNLIRLVMSLVGNKEFDASGLCLLVSFD